MKLKDVDPSSIDSPITPLLRELLKAPGIISPKRAKEISELVAKLKIRLELSDKPVSTDFGVGKDRRIRTSLRGLEHLWGSLHAYLLLMDITKAHPGQLVDLLASKEGQAARELLAWAFGNPKAPWPAGAPKPTDTILRLVVGTNNLFLLCGGFIFLHEVAHVVLGHTKQSASNPATMIRREYQADDWAVKFVLEGTDPADLKPRLIAIAATLGMIGGLELYGAEGDVRDHPFPTDRILHFLEKHVAAATDDPSTIAGCLMAAGIPIQAHLLKKGVGTMKPYQNFKEFFAAAKLLYPS